MDGTGGSRRTEQTRSIRRRRKGCRCLRLGDGHVRSESTLPSPVKPHLTHHLQILSGSAPFPNESDDEIVDKVAAGLRPEWPSNKQKLVDVLWKKIGACWAHEPNERPTAPEVLLTLEVLVEARHQGAEVSEDEAMMREWERVEYFPDSTF